MSKVPFGKNYTLLALAIVYTIIAVIQIIVPGILPIQLYFSVASISLLTTLCEAMKSGVHWIRTIEVESSAIALEGKNIIGKNIEMAKKYPVLSKSEEQLQEEYDKLSKYLEPKEENYWDIYLRKIDSAIPFVEIFEILCIAVITPLISIPNNLLINKAINVMSLLSLAFAFLATHLSDNTSACLEYYREKSHTYCQISESYLDILKKISENPHTQESEESQDDSNGKTL